MKREIIDKIDSILPSIPQKLSCKLIEQLTKHIYYLREDTINKLTALDNIGLINFVKDDTDDTYFIWRRDN